MYILIKKFSILGLIGCLFLGDSIATDIVTNNFASNQIEFPFGVYDKYREEPVGSEKWYEYYNRLADFLRDNSINSIVLPAQKNSKYAIDILDIMHDRNIKVIQTIGNPYNRKWDRAGPNEPFHKMYIHPAILAYKYGDEPKDDRKLKKLINQYEPIRKYYDKPVVTAMIGEIIDGNEGFVERAWKRLNTDIKFARYYTFRREYYLADFNENKTKLRFDKWCEYMELVHNKKPWWFIAQTFGHGKYKSHKDSYWRVPTYSEILAQHHLALANGARGIFNFSLQTFKKSKDKKISNIGLMDDSFVPTRARDNSVGLNAVFHMAKLVNENQSFFKNHEKDKLKIYIDNDFIYVTSRFLKNEPNKKYIYAVNMNTESIESGIIYIKSLNDITYVENYFNDKEKKKLHKNNNILKFHLKLNPGEGQIWEIKF